MAFINASLMTVSLAYSMTSKESSAASSKASSTTTLDRLPRQCPNFRFFSGDDESLRQSSMSFIHVKMKC